MSKNNVSFICQNCGLRSVKWSGRCGQCKEWNTLVEQIDARSAEAQSAKSGKSLNSTAINKIKSSTKHQRIPTLLSEVDVVLGGGVVPASVILLAGEPGIGKSTLLMQIANNIALSGSVLYVTAEESLEQVHLRATRLKVGQTKLEVASSTSTDDIVSTMHARDLRMVVVDSIQTVSSELIGANPGTTSQITNSAQLLIRSAKLTNTAIILVGHVTKEGAIAGPKILEHLVDVVLNLEGDRYGGFKLLRSAKNRFGSTNESGVFEMTETGLKSIDNPSAVLLAERQVSDGSVVLATMEGSRPLLVEVQALVNKTSFGYPKRTASGVDYNRLNLLIAMLSRRTKLNLSDYDVYINIVGGIRVNEPAADLALCMAIASASKGLKLKEDAVVFGEVGLSGEVRHVNAIDARIQEAKKLGFKSAIGPKMKKANPFIHSISNIKDALNQFLKQ
jgi:DNA repair protein RadA/Sms